MVLLMYRQTEFIEDWFERRMTVPEELLVEESIVVVVSSEYHTLQILRPIVDIFDN